jgi:hypothetical protein
VATERIGAFSHANFRAHARLLKVAAQLNNELARHGVKLHALHREVDALGSAVTTRQRSFQARGKG